MYLILVLLFDTVESCAYDRCKVLSKYSQYFSMTLTIPADLAKAL